jgi:hypothetical protein
MKLTFELVTMCAYCKLKGIETEATVNRRGYDLCVPCRDRSVKAEIDHERFLEQCYAQRG